MINCSIGTVGVKQIHSFLLENDEAFNPPFSANVDLESYASKLYENAVLYEAWEDEHLIGILAAYRNASGRRLYVPYICVNKKGVGKCLFDFFLMDNKEYQCVELEVRSSNSTAIRFYTRLGFVSIGENHHKQLLRLDL
jgi:hypothetical protein